MFPRLTTVILLAFAPAFSQQAAPSLDDIIQKHIDGMGGLEKLRAMQSVRMSGKVVMGGGQMEAPLNMQMRRPHSMRMEIILQGRAIVTAFDGTTAWMINPMQGSSDPQKMGEDETKSMKDQADPDGSVLVNYKDKGHQVELLGKEEVEGTPAWKLKVTYKTGNIDYTYLDAASYLVLKVSGKRKQMGQEFDIDSFPGNYKPVNGVLLPHTVENKMGGRTIMQMVFDKIEPNVALEDSIFQMPAKEEPKKEEPKKP